LKSGVLKFAIDKNLIENDHCTVPDLEQAIVFAKNKNIFFRKTYQTIGGVSGF
jgi:hypothetical protein